MIKIEKGILPPGRFRYEAVLAQMVPGDSFLVGSLSMSERAALYRELKHADGTFTTRTVEGGVRVWRRA